MSPLIGAIAAGNCAVVKPSEHSINTTLLIIELLDQIFDPKHIKVIHGDHQLGAELLEQRFDFIFFTGSTRVGKIVMNAAAKSLTPLVLELGGKSPCIVHYDANVKVAARRIAWGKYLNGGQTCIAPDYLMVHEKVKEEFTSHLKYYLEKFLGESKDEEYSCIIHQEAYDRLEKYLEDGKVVLGGKRDRETLYFEPTLLEIDGFNALSMQEEIFGPVMPIMTYKNLEGVIDRVRKLPKPMVVYFFSKSKRLQKIAMNNLPSGDFLINDTVMHFVSPKIPVGGVGFSGIGKYHGKESFRAFSHHKSVLRKPPGFEIPLRYPPYERNLGLVKKLIRYLY